MMDRRCWTSSILMVLIVLVAGCGMGDQFSCDRIRPGDQPSADHPATAPEDPAAEKAARRLLNDVSDTYQSAHRPFLPEQDYPAMVAALRAGMGKYGQTTLAPEMQFFLADVIFEQIKYMNNKSFVYMHGLTVGPSSQRLPGETFEDALRDARPFTEALDAYEVVYTRWPNSAQAPQAVLKMAEICRADYNPDRNLQQAIKYLQLYVDNYRHKGDADWALFGIATCYRELGNAEKAKEYYRELIYTYPLFPPPYSSMAKRFIDPDTTAV